MASCYSLCFIHFIWAAIDPCISQVARLKDAECTSVLGGPTSNDRALIVYPCFRPHHLTCDHGHTRVCKCAYKENPVDTKTCLPVPPSQGYSEKCGWILPCYPEYVCDNSTARDTCKCPVKEPVHNTLTQKCEGRTHGDSCSPTIADCLGELICQGSQPTCSCPANTPNFNQMKRMCQAGYNGDSCSNNNDCAGGTTCNSGQCTCADVNKSVWNDDKKECEGKGFGETCDNKLAECLKPFDCDEYVLVCKCQHIDGQAENTYDNSTKKCRFRPKYNQHCDTECEHSTIICSNFICTCADSTLEYHPGIPGRCLPKTSKSYEGPCTETDECSTSRGLACIENSGGDFTCTCPGNDEIWSEAVCKKKEEVTECNPDDAPNKCHEQNVENYECDRTLRRCTCPSLLVYAPWAMACKLQANQDCTDADQTTPLHDLCASQRCSDREINFNKCDCEAIHGIPQIYSSEAKGCVIDYLDFECNPALGNEQCQYTDFNTSRDGLVCNPEGRCQCDKGLSYIQAYCINATLLHGETCDRDYGPTCKIAGSTGLTCKNLGGGSYRCVCLPKNVSRRSKLGGKVLVGLVWDEDTQKCDLKKNGEICAKGYECRSNHCPASTGVCTRQVKNLCHRIHKAGILVTLISITLTIF